MYKLITFFGPPFIYWISSWLVMENLRHLKKKVMENPQCSLQYMDKDACVALNRQIYLCFITLFWQVLLDAFIRKWIISMNPNCLCSFSIIMWAIATEIKKHWSYLLYTKHTLISFWVQWDQKVHIVQSCENIDFCLLLLRKIK
jgi:hypothetical protein